MSSLRVNQCWAWALSIWWPRYTVSVSMYAVAAATAAATTGRNPHSCRWIRNYCLINVAVWFSLWITVNPWFDQLISAVCCWRPHTPGRNRRKIYNKRKSMDGEKCVVCKRSPNRTTAELRLSLIGHQMPVESQVSGRKWAEFQYIFMGS